MKKIIFTALIIFCSISAYAQHRVNDVDQYGGWYKITIEISKNGGNTYAISQCYPSGEIFDVIGSEKEKLPLILKILCLAFIEEYIGGILDINELNFDDDGLYFEMTNVSFSFVINFSRPEAELLGEIDPELLDEFRNRRWE